MTDLLNETPTEHGLDYEAALQNTKAEIQRLLRGAAPVIRHLTKHLARSTGKMIRARALLACAIQRDGSISADAVHAAVCAELLHLATLVHDDIIDDADQRRGIDTLHQKFGTKHAVLCGDYLFCTALEFISGTSAPTHRPDTLIRAFPSYLSAVCLGELRQNQNLGNYSLSEREYFKIIHGKTAALFEACFYAGFILSDAPDSAKDTYTVIGRNIGLIFQLCDDCADYTATQSAMKKPALSDYRRGVITLPLIYALKKDKSLLDAAKQGMSPADLKAAVEDAGGLAYTRKKVDKLYQETSLLLDTLTLTLSQRKLLSSLLGLAAEYTNTAVKR